MKVDKKDDMQMENELLQKIESAIRDKDTIIGKQNSTILTKTMFSSDSPGFIFSTSSSIETISFFQPHITKCFFAFF